MNIMHKTEITNIIEVVNVKYENKLIIEMKGVVKSIDSDNDRSLSRPAIVYLVFHSLAARNKDESIIRLYDRIDEGTLETLFIGLSARYTCTYDKGTDIYDKAIKALNKEKDRLIAESLL